MEIYHLTAGAIGWGPEERRQAGDVLIDPPDRIVERYGHKLDRLDDGNGKLPREIIDELPEYHLRRIARVSNEVDESADIEEIISVLESSEDHELGEVERQAAEVVRNAEQNGPLDRPAAEQAEAESQETESESEQERTLLHGDEQNPVDPEVEEQTEEILDEIDDRRERLAAEGEGEGANEDANVDTDAEESNDA